MDGDITAKTTKDPLQDEYPGNLGHIPTGMSGGSTEPSNQSHVNIIKAQASTHIYLLPRQGL